MSDAPKPQAGSLLDLIASKQNVQRFRHRFFDDPFGGGVDVQLMKLVRILRAAALSFGPEKRVILLHGPVSSAKSTIARLLKKGLKEYLTRLEDPTHQKLSLTQKAKLYDGRPIPPGFTEAHAKEPHKTAKREGLDGVSPRCVQDKVSNPLVRAPDLACLTPFMVLNELESGPNHHSLISNERQRERYREQLSTIKLKYAASSSAGGWTNWR